MFSVLCLSFATLFIAQANGHTHDDLSRQYTYSVQLDSQRNYTMFYSYVKELSILRIAVLVQTTGWVGLGISPTGQMPGSDVAIGWVDSSGKAFLQDRYAFARTTPRFDASQDWKLKGSSEEGGFTTLRFERALETCDEEDIAINFGDTINLIYSYHSEDPVDNEFFLQHQFQGSKIINLFGRLENPRNLSRDVQFLDIINLNASVPATDTTYLCTLREIPKVIQNRTHYIVKVAIQISPESARHVHHAILYLCEGIDLTGHPSVNTTINCDGIAQEVLPCQISLPIGVWGIGGNDFVYPEEVALPIGGSDKIHTHMLLEMHYDNPQELSGIVDSSGFRLYYTDQAPENYAGVLLAGRSVSRFLVIPPKAEQYVVFGYCYSNCTANHIPEEGITIFANFLHSHLAGVGLILRHVRNGVELNPIDVNHNYDSDFQQTSYVPNVKFLPGDELILECTYNTKDRNFTTFGGEGTYDEMCLTFLYYYPAIPIPYCLSATHSSAFQDWVEAYVPSDHHNVFEVAAAFNTTDARLVLDYLNWSNESYRMLEDVGRNADKLHICISTASGSVSVSSKTSGPPKIEVPLVESEKCSQGSGSAPLHKIFGLVVIMKFCFMALLMM